MRQDLWEMGHKEKIIEFHVTGHTPLVFPENETHILAKVHCLEKSSPNDAAQWLHQHMLHLEQQQQKKNGVGYSEGLKFFCKVSGDSRCL